MKVLIIEDELHNSRLLQGMLKKVRADWEVLEVLESVKQSVAWLKDNPTPDLIFMDIQLTDATCFSIFDQVKVESMIIFTTAYDEYAIQAFKVNSIDYLLKPIKSDQLTLAIEKFEYVYDQITQSSGTVDYTELLEAIRSGEKKYRKRFLVTGATAFFKIEAADVAYFYTENRGTFAVSFEGKEHVLDLTLEKLEEQLDPEQFFRANRSHIINSDSIRKFENYFGGKLIVRMVAPFQDPVTISRLKAPAFKEWLDR